jgi:hypothetical protein
VARHLERVEVRVGGADALEGQADVRERHLVVTDAHLRPREARRRHLGGPPGGKLAQARRLDGLDNVVVRDAP